ncbi:MAG: hypothetical protein ACLSTO_02735 [Bilophila wadsworthia]
MDAVDKAKSGHPARAHGHGRHGGSPVARRVAS